MRGARRRIAVALFKTLVRVAMSHSAYAMNQRGLSTCRLPTAAWTTVAPSNVVLSSLDWNKLVSSALA
jgi:hypothetical protein